MGSPLETMKVTKYIAMKFFTDQKVILENNPWHWSILTKMSIFLKGDVCSYSEKSSDFGDF